MIEISEADYEAALARGNAARVSEPRVAKVRFDKRRERLVVDLTNGCTFAFPPRLAQGLETATSVELSDVRILGAGYGLHWEALDVDLSIAGLLAGVFGARAYMARQAGRATSPAKADAARRNGAKGGRPRKLQSA